MIIRIEDAADPRVDVYTALTERQLNRKDMFIAESPKVIARALETGWEPVSLLCEEKHIAGTAAEIVAALGDIPIYTADCELLASLTGYTLTRGVLCAMRRRPLPDAAEICRNARRICVIYDVVDNTNVGSIFRATAALGFDAVLVTPGACDPLNRRSLRVSMGTVMQIPWTVCADPLKALAEAGIPSLAMALTDKSVSLDHPSIQNLDRLAVIVGNEGDGLPAHILKKADYTVRIPMYHQVDSLNVATAAAIAFWQLR